MEKIIKGMECRGCSNKTSPKANKKNERWNMTNLDKFREVFGFSPLCKCGKADFDYDEWWMRQYQAPKPTYHPPINWCGEETIGEEYEAYQDEMGGVAEAIAIEMGE